jgi:hypothetical protein
MPHPNIAPGRVQRRARTLLPVQATVKRPPTRTRPLDPEDIQPGPRPVVAAPRSDLGPVRPSVTEAASTSTRIIGGNFRLIDGLMSQIARVLDINQLDATTTEVVRTARETLVVGAQ